MFCVVAEIPSVGDIIHGNLTAVVEGVRITRDGRVHIRARTISVPLEQASAPEGEIEEQSAGACSPRVEAVLGR